MLGEEYSKCPAFNQWYGYIQLCFIKDGLECFHQLTVTNTELVLWFDLAFLQGKCSDISEARVNIRMFLYHTKVNFCSGAFFFVCLTEQYFFVKM